MKGISRKTAALIGTAVLSTSGLIAAGAGPAVADYGPTAIHQIELSANASGPQGGGVWLWFELSSDGSVDYSGADCGHGHGASSDRGSTWWSYSNDRQLLIIHNVILNGLGGFPATVTTPAANGHYTGTVGTFITLPPFIPPFVGNSQLQVAP